MQFEQWLFFVVSTSLISATPGSNMLLAFQFGLNYGVRKTLWALAGLSLGLFLLLLVSLAGIGYLNHHMPAAFAVMKIAGALYLAYLGVKTWQHADARMGHIRMQVTPTPWRLFRTGITVSLSNPKAILFFTAFFPKFLDDRLPLMSQYLILTASFFAIETTWQMIYTTGGNALSAWLSESRRLLILNRMCGTVFIVIAASLMMESVWH